MSECKTCSKPLAATTRSGYCRTCYRSSPERREKLSKRMKDQWKNDPAYRAKYLAAIADNLTKTGGREKGAQVAKEKETWRIASEHITPQARNRARRKLIENKIGHIPYDVRPLYYELTRQRKVPAEEATRIVLAHHETEMQRFRNKLLGR